MKTIRQKLLLAVLLIILTISATLAGGYEVGDIANDFSLKNIDGKMISLKDYNDAKGYIVVFTCNHCPYAKLYEQRIIDLHNKYASQGYPVIAINPNDPEKQPLDSYENMKKRAKEKEYPFAYLFDETQDIAKSFGASRTPHVYILKKTQGKRPCSPAQFTDNFQLHLLFIFNIRYKEVLPVGDNPCEIKFSVAANYFQ